MTDCYGFRILGLDGMYLAITIWGLGDEAGLPSVLRNPQYYVLREAWPQSVSILSNPSLWLAVKAVCLDWAAV